ncbi:PaaI family thioesterase, partial [Ferrovibrio sp.]|uniref:PaaI family thioesterase n=1 Tax=Ferrovibrio sp. TaxID=1917215 RepID=UPI00345D06B5
NGDYVGPSPLGSWVEGRGRVLRLTRSMAFADGLITADGEPAMRVSGIMKITARQVHARPLSSMFG